MPQGGFDGGAAQPNPGGGGGFGYARSAPDAPPQVIPNVEPVSESAAAQAAPNE